MLTLSPPYSTCLCKTSKTPTRSNRACAVRLCPCSSCVHVFPLPHDRYRVAMRWLRVLVKQDKFQTSELVAAAEAVTLADVQQIIPQLRDAVAFEVLVHGNINSADAVSVADMLFGKLGNRPLPDGPSYCRSTGVIPSGAAVSQVDTPNPDSVNSATLVRYQVGLRDLCDDAAFVAARSTAAGAATPLQQQCLDRSLYVDLLGTMLAVCAACCMSA